MNTIIWKYVKPLADKSVIREFEQQNGYTFDSDYANCVSENNGGRPSVSAFDAEVSKERSVKSLLSFNKDDKENIWNVNEWSKEDLQNSLVAIAIDNFGSLICLEKNSGKVIFFNHEDGSRERVAESFGDFLKILYE